MVKNIYKSPRITVIALQTGDVITLSNENKGLSISDTDFGFDSMWDWDA